MAAFEEQQKKWQQQIIDKAVEHLVNDNVNAGETNAADSVSPSGEIADEILVEEVKKRRILWDSSARGYKDTIKTNDAWMDISSRLQQNSEVLKRRWKNLRDGMMRCLKKINDKPGSSKTPTCKLFDQLLFLRDLVANNEAYNNVTLASGHAVDDLIPETSAQKEHTPSKSSGKRKLEMTDAKNANTPHDHLNKKADLREKIDLLLVKALSRSDARDNELQKSSNQLFADSIVEILDKLSLKKNRMARIEIQQILMKYEFDSDSL